MKQIAEDELRMIDRLEDRIQHLQEVNAQRLAACEAAYQLLENIGEAEELHYFGQGETSLREMLAAAIAKTEANNGDNSDCTYERQEVEITTLRDQLQQSRHMAALWKKKAKFKRWGYRYWYRRYKKLSLIISSLPDAQNG